MIIELQRGRVLRMYPGVVYEVDMLGGFGYAVLVRKVGRELLLVFRGIHKSRPVVLDSILKTMVNSDGELGFYLIFFPVSIGVRRGLLRALGIVRDIDKWSLPSIPDESDSRRQPWFWSRQKGWEFMPCGLENRQIYNLSSVCLLRLLRGKDRVVEVGKTRRKSRKVRSG